MKRAGWGWHSDGEDKVLPNAGSFIHALELPPADGDTLYADTYAAFAALPDDVRGKIMGRRACFSRARFHEVYYPHLPPLTEEQKERGPTSGIRSRAGIRIPAGRRSTSGAGRTRSTACRMPRRRS